MARPPAPSMLTTSNRTINYFELLIIWTMKYVEKDGITLNFKGYSETINAYTNLQEHETKKAWELARDLNAWSEYFSDVANLIQKLYLDANTEKVETIAVASIEADDKKVANGERLANKDKRVVDIRKRRNTLQSFYDELISKVKFLERAHYHCKATAESKSRFMNQPQNQGAYAHTR